MRRPSIHRRVKNVTMLHGSEQEHPALIQMAVKGCRRDARNRNRSYQRRFSVSAGNEIRLPNAAA